MGKTGKKFKSVHKARGFQVESGAFGQKFVSGNLIGGCLTKQAFPYESTARRVAKEMGKKRGIEFFTYSCCFCGQYHISGMNLDKQK